MELTKRNIRIILLIIAASILLFLGVQNLAIVFEGIKIIIGLIAPLLIGLCIAFILNVLMKLIEERLFAPLNKKNYPFWNKSKRPLSLVLTIGIISGIIFVLIFQIVPEMKNTISLIKDQLPDYMHQVQIWSEKMQEFFKLPDSFLKDFKIDWDRIGETIMGFLQNDNINFLSRTKNITTSIFSGIFNIFIGFVFSIYMLSQKEKLSSQARRILFAFLPNNKAESIVSVAVLSNRIFSRFVTGQCTEALILGILCFIGMNIFSMPYSFMISALIGFTALIPVFGALFGTAIGAFLILMVDPMQALWFIIFIIVLQRFDAYFIYPRVVGSSVGLPGMWVLFAVIVGGSAFGIIGMLIGVPVFSIIYCLLQQAVSKRLKMKGLSIKEIEAIEPYDYGKK
ncbi:MULTISPECIES: AI-2E family transporter [Bacillus]|uniref:AI-2E family transporter n=1 Tax=Bacillus TaxID=1386 RepID=UPI0003004DE9|nr:MULTISPECIES: AI-2E family transporter [Bacillus]